MSVDDLKEINNLLENILVFEIKFKEEILAKAENLDAAGLKKLKIILSEVNKWQGKILDKKIKEDHDFYNKIIRARKKSDEEIISLYKQKLNDEDHKKMEIILSKINSV
ncbi:MAG: hypothetical protein G01um101413_488 [Parcubacteria group bacterium Gr01-1014_13]|nr:MAG: hypothetical protein G01um101413_488 [Parcubacteria group bacterium Gr01-1014_13]